MEYDKIHLMSGVYDQGMDCTFYQGDQLAGIIQGKHSADRRQLKMAGGLYEWFYEVKKQTK